MKSKLMMMTLMMCLVGMNSFGQEINVEKYRKLLKVNVDELSGDVNHVIPYSHNNQIQFRKYSTDTYYMCLNQSSSSIYTGTGVTIYFEDGTKIERPDVKLDYRLNSVTYKFDHSVWLSLSEEEWSMLESKNLKGIKMYIFDIFVKKPEEIRAYVQLIRE